MGNTVSERVSGLLQRSYRYKMIYYACYARWRIWVNSFFKVPELPKFGRSPNSGNLKFGQFIDKKMNKRMIKK